MTRASRSFDALIAPFLIDRPELQTAVLHSDVASDMLAGLDGSGLTGIGILPAFMRHPGGITHPFVDVSDYQGASFATPPDVVRERSLAALGAIPTASMGGSGLNLASFDGTDQKLSTAERVRRGREIDHHECHVRAATDGPLRQYRSTRRAQRTEPHVPAAGRTGDDRCQDRQRTGP